MATTAAAQALAKSNSVTLKFRLVEEGNAVREFIVGPLSLQGINVTQEEAIPETIQVLPSSSERVLITAPQALQAKPTSSLKGKRIVRHKTRRHSFVPGRKTSGDVGVVDQIRKTLASHKSPLKLSWIAAEVYGKTTKSAISYTQTILRELVEEGEVAKVGRGLYVLAAHANSSVTLTDREALIENLS